MFPLLRCLNVLVYLFCFCHSLCAETVDVSTSRPISASLHLDWIDTKQSPQIDFYDYANGTWQKENPIPQEYSVWSHFSILQKKMQTRLKTMMAQLSQNKHLVSGSIEQKIGDFYASGMDANALNHAGYSPLKPMLDEINALKTRDDFLALVPDLQRKGVNVIFNFGSMQDYKHSKRMIAAAMQGGLGLPDRDYYVSDDKKMVQIRASYQKHLIRVFQLLGDSEQVATKHASTVVSIETALARASLTQTEQRNPYAIYHPTTMADLQVLMPHFSWSNYLKVLNVTPVQSINIGMPQFFKTLDQLLVSVPLEDWKVYARWQVLNAFSDYLSDQWVNESFQFDQSLTGIQRLQPRWQRVVSTVNSELGFAVGKYYVEHYFSESSKQSVISMMSGIRETFRHVLENESWMTESTKKSALKKLDLMTQRAGYPDHWRNYDALSIDRGPYVNNVIRANAFNYQYDLEKIGKPVDLSEWSMSPQTINAYYDPSLNSINILAGILQPPFFDPDAPAAVNYGAIGFVIGHEMTHGFDDQGALFDGAGNLKNWWTPQDMKAFKVATQCIADQYSKYHVDGDARVQGNLVMGEATADLGGILLAYQAFHASPDYQHAKTIDGFSPDQQFFLGAAHVWAGNIRPEWARSLVTLDPHPPMKYRVNGTLANIPAFQQAFHVSLPSPMVNQPRCQIW